MDRERFDALARLVATSTTRRTAMGALLGGALSAALGTATARKGRDRKSRGRNTKQQGRARIEASSCCATGNCAPGAGKNLARCCYEDQNLTGKTFKGANLGGADFSGAILTNANFTGANLDKTCFIGADVTGAKFTGANTGTAIFCRTRTSQGIDDSGCQRGTRCCPACAADADCADCGVCREGRCVANTRPVAVSNSFSGDEGTTCLQIILVGSDADGHGLTFQVTSLPTNGSLAVSTDSGPGAPVALDTPINPGEPATAITLCYTPFDRFFHGTDEFTYTAADACAESEPATVAITINDINL